MGKDNQARPPASAGHHWLYSWVNKKTMPSGRAFQGVRRELSRLREDLIAQYGGDKITPQAVIIIDSIVEALGVQKLQGLYIRKAGIIRQDSLKAGNLELHSILSKNWISYANVIRQGLMALKELGGPKEEPAWIAPWEDEPGPVSQAEKEAIARPGASESDSDGQEGGS